MKNKSLLLPLSKQGKLKGLFFAIVDSEAYEMLNSFRWSYHDGYAARFDRKTTVLMHRQILGFPLGLEVDHINGNKLDNRRSNLRIATRSENCRNMPRPQNNTSGYKGVSWSKIMKRWHAYIKVNQKRINLGFFDTRNEAASTYNRAAIKYHGDFAALNSIC